MKKVSSTNNYVFSFLFTFSRLSVKLSVTLFFKIRQLTRIYSSRMRTAASMAISGGGDVCVRVCVSMGVCVFGCVCPGVCVQGWVCVWGCQGGCTPLPHCMLGYTPPLPNCMLGYSPLLNCMLGYTPLPPHWTE